MDMGRWLRTFVDRISGKEEAPAGTAPRHQSNERVSGTG
jgi:hypothetical protein